MTEKIRRTRRFVALLFVLLSIATAIVVNSDMYQSAQSQPQVSSEKLSGSAAKLLEAIAIKGRAPKTDYSRDQFGSGWGETDGCNTRDIILYRDLQNVAVGDGCRVIAGTLNDPYTGKVIKFVRGPGTSSVVQIDHVVALGDAWQTGAQQLSADERKSLANDPLELLAVDGPANQQKSDSDAASWLPPNKAFRCQYVARQVAVKARYHLWMTWAEHDAILRILAGCPGQPLPKE